MSASLRIRFSVLGSYLGLSFFLFLGGIWFNPLLSQIFLGLMFFLLLSWGQLFLSVVGLRLHEEFNTTHPRKGDTILYTWEAAYEGPIHSCLVTLTFKKNIPGGVPGLGNQTLFLRSKELRKEEAQFSCRFRGVYELGIESVTFRDLLGTIEWERQWFPTTFYVAPRVIRSDFHWLNREKVGLNHWSALSGQENDPAAFRNLEPYRPGAPWKNLVWRTVAQGGDPAVRRFETMSEEGIAIYLDLRRVPDEAEPPEAILEKEDACLELLLSLISSLLENGITVKVHVWSHEPRRWTLQDRRIEAFVAETVTWTFGAWIDPTKVALEDLKFGRSLDTLVVVSPFQSDGTLSLADVCLRQGVRFVYLTPSPGGDGTAQMIQALIDRGAQAREVKL